jgi:hypothetical protein
MKKSIRNFVLLSLLLGFVACEGPTGPPGRDGADGWANIAVAYYTITSWQISAGENYFYADVDFPELTEFVYNEGVVNGYYMQNFNASDEVQIPLPFDIYFNEDGVSWTETISFDIVPGNIRFYYEPSDFFIGFNPPVCTFKIALTW